VESALGKKLASREVKAPTEVKSSVTEQKQVQRSCAVSLMDICRLDTPLLKRIPNSQRSAFATAWGRLLDEATHSGQLSAWSDFFMYPKCILWTPVRGGSRLSKKRSMADLVKARIAKWKSDPDSLWKDVVERSKKLTVAAAPTRPDNSRVEATVIAALRLGDVRKALQLLNSAPIAPKTEATLNALKSLHPTGPNPAPVPPHEVVRFTQDVCL